ncbi:outer membrane beta-barrel protein [Caulobacter sp. NIBR2454]|uniref:outer membrane beta-barrel protein n=1 Tax=Caulobacter sp. NIBR2454 TaxID=3015996 RepID=UPI0022B60BFF|nr:outer membrane beta-barrel protein [Caulobacter sp. NIBR2454]
MRIKLMAATVAATAMAAMFVPMTVVFAQTARGALNSASDAQGNFARDRNVSVRQRPHPEYDAMGIRSGAFMLYPQVTASVDYSDNIYGAATNKADDFIFKVQPSLSLASTWSRHALSAYANAAINRYVDFSTEDTEDFAFGADGRIDIVRGSNIALGGNYNRITEPRTSSSTPTGSVDPIQYDLTQFNIAGVHELNRLRLSARGDYRKFNYDDGRTVAGAPVEQDDRDREITSFTGRAEYALSPATAFFVQGAVNKRDYRLQPPVSALDRDSDGYEVLAGANFELSALMRGEFGVGYISQKFDDPTAKKIDGLGARAQVEWFPTQLTTVTFTGARSIEDSGIPGSSGYLSSAVGAQVDHELRRNIILTGKLDYANDDYDGIERKDKRFNAGVSATYLLNRRLGVVAGYSYFDQNSKGLNGGEDFKVNRVSLGLTGRF